MGFQGSNTGVNTFAPQLVDQPTANQTFVSKNGAGTWTLSNTGNTYSGGTIINLGQIIETAPGTAGTSGQLGTGLVTVGGGANASLLISGAGTYANAISLGNSTASAGGLQLQNGANVSGTVTLSGGATTRISGTAATTTSGTVSGQIMGGTAGGNLFFDSGGLNASSTVTLANVSASAPNNYAANTVVLTNGTSGGTTETLSLGASNQIPNGTTAGNVFLNVNYSTGTSILQLNGFNETINGLNSAGGGAEYQGYVQNSSATTNSTLTLGDSNASGNFLGGLRNNAANATTGVPTLSLVKIGTGTQTLGGILTESSTLSPGTASTLTGGVTVSAGTLSVDFSQATGQATTTLVNPTNYVPATEAVSLNGGTLQAVGRGVGTAQAITETTFISRNNGIQVTAAQAATIQPGQTLTTSFTNNATTYYVTYVDRVNNYVYFNTNALANATSGVSNTYTFAAYSGAMSNQSLGGVTLGAGASGLAVNDNGAGATVVNLGAITRNAGGTVDFTLPTGATASATEGITTISSGNVTNGIVTSATGTAYATVNGGTDWASLAATGTPRNIVPYSSTNTYGTNTFTAGTNADVSGAQAPTAFTVNTLRFNSNGATLDVSGAGPSTVSTGGILVTPSVNGTGVTINNSSANGTGGGIRAGAGMELVIINNGLLTVNAPIVNSASGASALTVSGTGATTISGVNTYTGATTLNGGTYGTTAQYTNGVYTPGPVYTNAGGTTALPVQTVTVNSTSSGLGTGALTINNNAVLAGTGALNNPTTTVNGGGTIAPGTAANPTGILTMTSNVAFTGSTGSLANYAANVTATSSNLLQINGTLNLSGTLDQLSFSSTSTTGLPVYVLLTATGGITGTFDNTVNLPSGYTLAYDTDDVYLTNGTVPVPEPGTWMFMWAGGVVAWLLAGRRRRAGKGRGPEAGLAIR